MSIGEDLFREDFLPASQGEYVGVENFGKLLPVSFLKTFAGTFRDRDGELGNADQFAEKRLTHTSRLSDRAEFAL